MGGGVDLIDYAPNDQRLFVGFGAIAMLRIVSVGANGAMTVVASAPTATGARNALVDEHGRAYLADSVGGRILVTDALPWLLPTTVTTAASIHQPGWSG